MNDTQMLTIALAAVPTMLTMLIGILLNNARLSDVNSRLGEFRSHMDARFNDVDRRFDRVDGRFEEMKEMWRTELHRVEEVIDARLRHLEER
jgi:hypothetical protein